MVETASILDVSLPSSIADAVADADLIDAAIAQGRANPVVAALHGLARRPGLGEMRARTIRRLIDGRVRGIDLAYLAIEIGDYESAVTLAIVDFEEDLAGRLSNPDDPVISAWLELVVEAPEPVRREFLAAFGDRKDALLSYLRPEQRARLEIPK